MTLRAEQTALSLEDLRLVAALGHAGSLAGAARRIAVNHTSARPRLGALAQRLCERLFSTWRAGSVALRPLSTPRQPMRSRDAIVIHCRSIGSHRMKASRASARRTGSRITSNRRG